VRVNQGGAETKKAGIGAPVEFPAIAPPPNVPKDGVVGERVDRASQASRPVEVLENSDSRVVSAITKAGAAPGPKISSGPGEVPAVPTVVLPASAPSASELIAPAGTPAVTPVKPKDAPTGETSEGLEVTLPPPPEEVKLDDKAKAKRRRFDEKSARLANRTAAVSQFSNADGSSTAVIGKGGAGLDDKGKVVDADPAVVKDAKGRLKKSAGVVRASVPESLVDDSEVLSVGVPGARIGLGIRKPDALKGKSIPAVAKGSDVSFAEVFGPGTALRYAIGEGGVKEEIVLNAAPATGEVAYRFPLTLDGYTARVNPAGSISFLDAEGKEAWVIPLAMAWELPATGRPTVFGKVAVTLEKNADGSQDLVVRPDEKWLRDPARKFPVVVDPTITPGQGSYGNGYGYVDSDYPTWHLTTCWSWGTACVGTYSATHVAYDYLRYDVSPVIGQIVNSASLKLSIPRCQTFPNTFTIRPLSTPFDAATITWPSRPVARPESTSVVVSGIGVVSVDVSAWVAKYASGEWNSYGFQIASTAADCDLQVFGPTSSYLEVTYTAPDAGTNRQPSTPVVQSPLPGSTVSPPVTLSVTSIDPDGDQLWYYYQGCRQPCGGANVQFNSGWTTSNSWVLPNTAPGEYWGWWAYAYDGITSYVYNGANFFTVAATSGPAYQESWAWGTTPDYSRISTDNQPNAGVNTGTKRFVYSATDAQVAWSGPSLSLTRTYNSGDTTVGAFGLGWSSILDSRVDADASQNLTFRLPDGRRQYHPFVNGAYRTEPGYWSTANTDPQGGWTLLEKDGTTWRFLADGRLASAMDRNGRTLLLQYNAGTNKVDQIRAVGYVSSRALSITWTGNQVTSISDGTNAPWNYLYSGNTLTRVCDPRNNNTSSGLCITYTYGYSPLALYMVTKPGGNKDVEVGYNADGTVGWRRDGLNQMTYFAYDPGTRTATVTDPLSRVTTEQYNALGQIILRTEPGDANIPSQTTTYTYDSNGYLAKSTTPLGSWEYVNDYRGNQVEVKDPTGARSYYSFSNRDQVIAYRDARSGSSTDNTYRWTYGYDANGNRVRESNPYGWSRTWTYQISSPTALPGTLTQEADWLGNITNYTYNGIGDVTSITYPGVAGDNVVYSYDALGRKTSEYGRIASPGITYTYDPLNAPLTITEPPVTNPLNGVVHRRRITLTYNANHLKESEVVSDIGGSGAPDVPKTTTYTYDGNDRETSSTDPLGSVTSRTFDATGNVVTVTDGRGSTMQTDYNARNLPSRVSAPGYDDPTDQSSVGYSLKTMQYDGAGRLSSQNLNGVVRTYSYDAMNRMLTTVLPTFIDRNGVARSITEVQYSYDAIGNKTFERTGNNTLVHAYVYDQAGRLVQDNNQTQPRWDWFTLDRNGNVTSAQRVTTGNVVLSKKDTTFDARNRPLTITIDMGGTATNRTTTYTYSPFGTVLTETNPLNAVSSYTYDVLGRVSTVSAPSASHEDVGGVPVTSWAAYVKGYDTFGNLTHDRDPKGAITTTTFDKNSRRTRVDHPACSSGCQSASAYETWSYDQVGNTTSSRDRRGAITNYLYDTLNRNVEVNLPAVAANPNPRQRTQYDPVGNVTRTINEVYATVNYTYDQRNQPRTLADGSGGTRTFDYNDLGQRVYETDYVGYATTHEYLQTGEMTKTTDPVGAVTTAEYDALGRQVKTTDPMGRVTTTGYTRASEPNNNTRLVSGAAYSTQTATYDAAGNLKTTVSPVGVTTEYTYDPLRRVTGVTLAPGVLNITSTYGYDRNSNLTRTTNGNTAITTYTYNQWNLLASTVEPSTAAYPSMADRTYTTTYDAGGLPVNETEPGTSVTRTYDALARPTAATWTGAGQATVQKTYGTDARGRLTSITQGSESMSFSYNFRDQIAGSSANSGVNNVGYGYDANGNMTSRNQSNYWGNGDSYSFYYTPRNELYYAYSSTGGPLYNVYNLAGQVSQRWEGPGWSTYHAYSYDGVGRLTGDAISPAGSVAYTYFADDAVQSKTVSVPGNAASGVHSYTYDAADRLKTWGSGAGTVTYGYDGAGNRTSAGGQSFVYDARNRLSSSTSGSYSWAARGTPVSQTVSGQTTSYTTDAANRVTGVAGPGGTVTYGLDGLDRVSTRSLNGADPLVSWYGGFDKGAYEEKTSSWSTLKATDRLPDGSVYYARDLQGTGPTGPVVSDIHGDAIMWGTAASKLYDPFGAVIGTTGLPSTIGYQSDYTDPTTGDVNMGARWYNPSTATFRSRDSYAGKLQTPFSLNRYTYGLNNPMRYWDPTGHDASELGAIDWSNVDLAGLQAANPVSQPAADGGETFPLGDGSYVYIGTQNGETVFAVTAPTGITTSSGQSYANSGNLSYTPNQATAAATQTLFTDGHTAAQIAAAIDAQSTFVARNTTNAIIQSARFPDDSVSRRGIVTFGGCTGGGQNEYMDASGMPTSGGSQCPPPVAAPQGVAKTKVGPSSSPSGFLGAWLGDKSNTGYDFEFNLGKSKLTAKQAWAQFLAHPILFDTPFAKRGNCTFVTGRDCSLLGTLLVPSPMHVDDVGSVSMTFTSRPGHPEGSGNQITFQMMKPKDGNLVLHVVGSGPYDGPAAQLGGISRVAVYEAWRGFAFNLKTYYSGKWTI
jgi:RHS repeat-associated protein